MFCCFPKMDLRLALLEKLGQNCWQRKIGREEPVHFVTGLENLCKAKWVFKWLGANVSCVHQSELPLLLLLSLLVEVVFAQSKTFFVLSLETETDAIVTQNSSAFRAVGGKFCRNQLISSQGEQRGPSRSTAFCSLCKFQPLWRQPIASLPAETPQKFISKSVD